MTQERKKEKKKHEREKAKTSFISTVTNLVIEVNYKTRCKISRCSEGIGKCF